MNGLYNDRNIPCTNESHEYCNDFNECNVIYKINKLCKLQCTAEEAHSPDNAQSACSEVDSFPQDLPLEHNENPSIGVTTTVVPILVSLFAIFPILYKVK